MAISVLFNGVVYSIPETGEESWGENLTTYFVAIPQGALQKTGGSFTLSAEVNFGATYGLLSAYFKTRASNPSTAGLVRLAPGDSIGWRNTAHDGNLLLGINGSDQLTFNGSAIYPGGITALTGDVTATGPGSVAATIANNAVTDAKFRQSAALSVVGNATNSTANVADITAGTDHFALVRSGTALTFALLVNANIDPAAAIAYSKLDLTGSIVNADISGSAAIAYSKLALTGSIVNADISGSAAIAYSKLALTGSIVNADINASAAIAYSKLALTGSIVNADINASAAIAYSKLNLSGSIVNADISSSAAIANSKLATMADKTVKGNFTGGAATPSDVSAVSTATASTVAYRDSNANLSANNVSSLYATTATAGTTTTLTVASPKIQYFTGSTTQNCVLPDATTLPNTGFQFFIVNLSSGIVTVKDAGGNTIQAMAGSSFCWITAKSIASSNGSWDPAYSVNNAGGGTVTSVAMTVPTALFATSPVSGSPVTTSGTLAPTLATQTANTLFAGPTSGSAATPTFRALAASDIPLAASDPGALINLGFSTSVSSHALTINLKQSDGSSDPSSDAPVKIAFRSSTSANGNYNLRSATAATSIVLAQGSTLGLASNIQSYLWVYAIDNSGTVELAVSSTRFPDGSIVSTTTVGAGSTSNSTIYSTTGRSNVPIRLLARMTYTEGTAGTWDSNVSEISLATRNLGGGHISAVYSVTTGQSLTSTGIVKFDTLVKDNLNAYSTSTGIFTAPRADYYKVSWQIFSNTVTDAGSVGFPFQLRVNSTAVANGYNSGTGSANQNWNACTGRTVYLAKGDTIDIYNSQAHGAGSVFSDTNFCYFSIDSLDSYGI